MSEQPTIPLPFQVSRLATSYWVPQAIHAAAALGVADALAAGPQRSADVARAVGADPAALERLLRALVVIELCTATDDGAFALTPLGDCLRSDSRDSVRSWVLLIGGERCWSAWGRLAECVRTGRSVPALEGRDSWVDAKEDAASSATFNQSMVQLTRHMAGAVACAPSVAVGVRSMNSHTAMTSATVASATRYRRGSWRCDRARRLNSGLSGSPRLPPSRRSM